jgi:two-component system repressor protein LuxO
MKGTILLVDDKANRHMIAVLEEMGFLVCTYYDGRDAIRDIKDNLKYQLALVDLSLSDISGEDVVEASKEVNPDVPVIGISAYGYKQKKADKYASKTRADDMLRMIESYLK